MRCTTSTMLGRELGSLLMTLIRNVFVGRVGSEGMGQVLVHGDYYYLVCVRCSWPFQFSNACH